MPVDKATKELIRKKMPGYHVVEEQLEGDRPKATKADSVSASLEAMKSKVRAGAVHSAAADHAAAEADDAEAGGGGGEAEEAAPARKTRLVEVEPDTPSGVDRRIGRKVVIVEGDEIVGEQG